jgi:hypothetical protein
MGWVGHVTCIGGEICTEFWLGSCLEDLGVGGVITVKQGDQMSRFLRRCPVFQQGKNGTQNSPISQQFFYNIQFFHCGMQAAVGA